MYGAILGDMIGSPYEFDRGRKTKDFPFFMAESAYTDDSVMTIAVAEALMDSGSQPEEKVKENLVRSMRSWGRRYMYAGYSFCILAYTDTGYKCGNAGSDIQTHDYRDSHTVSQTACS